ncbi:MAG: hypothetical protein II356_01030 [Clostridia bacterium]|nr:hypothetical protein [Clostridia bacterium]MBQ1996637.1 hypothetical protein [Clostridia bacterium]
MEKTVKKQRLIIIILAVALVVAFVQLNGYKTESENRFNNLSNQIQRVSDDIQSIYGNVDDMLEEEASLVTSFNYEYGKLDAENRLVPVSVKITPKTLTDKTVITLDFGSEKVQLKRGDGGEFTADFNAPLFPDTESEVVKLLIKDGNTTQTQELDWYISSLHSNYLPELMAGFTFDKTSFSEEKGLTVDGDVFFMGDIEESGGTAFTDLKLVYMINDKIVDEQEIPETAFETAFDDIDVYKTYPDAKAEDTFTLYIEGVDEYGLVHRITVKEIVCISGEETSEESLGNYETILDKNGNVLYEGGK